MRNCQSKAEAFFGLNFLCLNSPKCCKGRLPFFWMSFHGTGLHQVSFSHVKPFQKGNIHTDLLSKHTTPLLCAIAKLSSSFKNWTRKSTWDIWEVSFPHQIGHWLPRLSCWSYHSNLKPSFSEGNSRRRWSWSEHMPVTSGSAVLLYSVGPQLRFCLTPQLQPPHPSSQKLLIG